MRSFLGLYLLSLAQAVAAAALLAFVLAGGSLPRWLQAAALTVLAVDGAAVAWGELLVRQRRQRELEQAVARWQR